MNAAGTNGIPRTGRVLLLGSTGSIGVNTIEVIETDGTEYETGFPNNTEESLVNSLERNNVTTDVKGAGGGGIASVLIFVLPFVLFLGFFIFIMSRMQGGGSRLARPGGGDRHHGGEWRVGGTGAGRERYDDSARFAVDRNYVQSRAPPRRADAFLRQRGGGG